jgi:hypothetical protein
MTAISCRACSHAFTVSIRLANGTSSSQGRVEVLSDGQWWTLCGLRGWDGAAAAVVCRQLGLLSSGARASGGPGGSGGSPYGGGSPLSALRSHWLCHGSEAGLSECASLLYPDEVYAAWCTGNVVPDTLFTAGRCRPWVCLS